MINILALMGLAMSLSRNARTISKMIFMSYVGPFMKTMHVCKVLTHPS
jgi:hypothetical protein